MSQNVLLVAEDDPNDALLLERALRRTGSAFRMVHVSDGDECIAYVEGTGVYRDRNEYPLPTVLLLDLKMPGRDGFGVLEWRKAVADRVTLPVVVFSSSGLREDIKRAYLLGANSYVVKPTAPDKLGTMIKALQEWWLEFNASLSPSAC